MTKMNFFWKQIGAFIIAFAFLYAVYDFVTFFTEEPYIVEIVKCTETWESGGDIYSPSFIQMRFRGIYKNKENSYYVDVEKGYAKDFKICDRFKKANVWISRFSPSKGRLIGPIKNWAERLVLSMMLFALGSVIYYGNKK
jgi:hypothetical protein